MKINQGVSLWKVETIGGNTELVHGYFSNFQAAERYVYDLFHSTIPVCNLIEHKAEKAENSDITSDNSDILLYGRSYSWWQELYVYDDDDYEYGYDLPSNMVSIGRYLVTASIIKVPMHINEGIYDLDACETAADWLEKHGASTRTVNCMRRKSEFCYRSIYYMADHAYDLYSVRNLGRKSLDEILSLLDKEGIKYVMEKSGFDEIIL